MTTEGRAELRTVFDFPSQGATYRTAQTAPEALVTFGDQRETISLTLRRCPKNIGASLSSNQ
jgi:hypothetical protein